MSFECRSGLLTGDASVRTQEDLNRLAGCETIDGSLSIVFATDLDTSPLSRLRRITGRLDVRPAGELPSTGLHLSSLDGLAGLSSVREIVLVQVAGGPGLLAGLSGPVEWLVLADVTGLRDLSPFAGITVTRDLSVEFMPELVSLEGISVAPVLERLAVRESPRLETLSGLDGLEQLVSLDLYENAALRSVALPDSVRSLEQVFISGALQLRSLAELSRFAGLQTLSVFGCPLLSDLGGDGSVEGSLQQLRVGSCPALTRLDPVGGLSALSDVTVDDCDALTEVDALAASATLAQLSVSGNASLVRLPVFERVEGSMTYVKVRDNAALVTGPSFPRVSTLSYVESLFHGSAELEITDNPLLSELGDFSSLTSLQMFTLVNNPALTRLSLPGVQSLNWLKVRDNAGLTSVELGLREPSSSALAPELRPPRLAIVELVGNRNLSELDLGAPRGPLSTLELVGNDSLAPSDGQRLLDLVDAETALTLD